MNNQNGSHLGFVTVAIATLGASVGLSSCKPKVNPDEAKTAAQQAAVSSVAAATGLSRTFRP